MLVSAGCERTAKSSVPRSSRLVRSAALPLNSRNYTSICLRGLSNVVRAYGPNRVRYPMRRVEGTERGAGQWERVTWDDAIAEIAEKLSYYRDVYGGLSIVKDGQAGNLGKVNGPGSLMSRLAQCVGMTLSGDMYDRMSCAGTYRVMGVGPYCFSNEPADVPNADMVLIWGTNPIYAAPHMWRFIRMAQDKGAKLICSCCSACASSAWRPRSRHHEARRASVSAFAAR